MSPLLKRPAFLLFLAWLLCLALCVTTIWFALQQQWLGVTLTADGSMVRIQHAPVPDIPENSELLSLKTTHGPSIALIPSDLPEWKNVFSSYADLEMFFSRQETIHTILNSNEVQLVWLNKEKQEQISSITPGARPLSSLPGIFWFQIFIVSACFLIACWVLILRPTDWGARMFAVTGLMLFISGIAAALYGARELAMSEVWMRGLQTGNLLAVYLYGCALIAMFLCYPKSLVHLRILWFLPATYIPWFIADLMQLLPSPAWGVFTSMLSQMLFALTVAIWQWRQTRGHPVERASLRWFLLSVLLGCFLFTLTDVIPPLLGMEGLLPAGYDFGFFLIMYAGIALGLRRYRLFDMNEWAYRVLLWVGGATLVIVLDALLIVAGLSLGISLGISLLLSGWLYFPLRQWLWQRMVNRRIPSFESLLPELSAIAFAAGSETQHALWQALLRRIYEPLELQAADANEVVGIRDDGLVMVVPGNGELPSMRLRHAGHGARLFSTRDIAFAASLSQALERMMGGRQSFEEGASQERQRIYRDLHDDMGAKLLGLAISAQRANLHKEADLARSALQDLRDVVSRATHTTTPLADLLADWRIETQQRVQAAGLELDWRFPQQESDIPVSPEAALHLSRILRETVTNVLRHAQASRIRIDMQLDDGHFSFSVEDDGIGLPPQAEPHRGMSSMQARAATVGATLDWQAVTPHGCRVDFSVPLDALTP